MLDRKTNKTNRISKSYFVFHFFNNKREEEKVRPSILILHFCIFFNAKVGVLNVQRCKTLNSEINTLKKLMGCSYAISFVDLFQTDKAFYIVMEHGGIGLSNYLHAKESVEFHERLNIIKQISRAVSFIHEQGIAHCDLNPSNILINSEGMIKLCDFGFSVEVENTRNISMCGTIGFYSPQMFDANAVLDLYKNDSWSTGVTFIYILCKENLLFRLWVAMYKQNKLKENIVNSILEEFVKDTITNYMNDGISHVITLSKCILQLVCFEQEKRQYIHDLNKKYLKHLKEDDYTIEMIGHNEAKAYANDLIYTYLFPKKVNKIMAII